MCLFEVNAKRRHSLCTALGKLFEARTIYFSPLPTENDLFDAFMTIDIDGDSHLDAYELGEFLKKDKDVCRRVNFT